MSTSPVLDLAIRLWPQVRDRGAVDDPNDLDTLLAAQGHRVIGPTVREGVIVLDEIAGADDLPAGWTEEQDAATYRLVRRDDDFNSDYFQIVIDGYHDHLSRAFFLVNPSGSKSD